MKNTSVPITRAHSTYAGGIEASGGDVASASVRAGFDDGRASGPLAGLPSRSRGRRQSDVASAGLSTEERAMIGVARWPDPRFDTSGAPANVAYGHRFADAVDQAALQLNEGELKSFADLWRFARYWRSNQEGATSDFGQSRSPSTGSSMTPVTDRYEFLADRVKQANAAEVSNHFMGRSDIQQVKLLQHVEIEGKMIRLTEIRLPYLAESSFTELADIGGMIRPLISHVPASRIPTLLNEVDRSFAVLRKTLRLEDRMQILGKMHWLLAHAMPDVRGSAAKAEMCIRAIGTSLGLTMPPFRHGVIPDLEAFVVPMEDFSKGYSALFERPPTQK
ncbi:XopAH/AvrB family type III secretion system effector [Xanthomonas arboricola pv. corylina]|uniref:XopAH/AvrB family type III secretion system effector n=1 Tax=Xanthomonas arboricola TaxID=56448 RepID=UPI004040AEF3